MNNENKNLPLFLKELLLKEYNEKIVDEIIDGYNSNRYTTFRINYLKGTKEEVLSELDALKIKYEESLIDNSYKLLDYENSISSTKAFLEGKIYLQSISSMIPALVLNPIDSIDILDMTAAPGSKTSMLSDLIKNNNKAHIMAVEKDKIRGERLKFNLNKLGCKNVNVLVQDALKLDEFFSFDSILLDAPCSGSGTLSANDKSFDVISEKLIKNSSILQTKLFHKALSLLKVGHTMVYSTCSILSCENEDVINRELKNKNIEIVPIEWYCNLPKLPSSIAGVLKIMPTKETEGFFVAKIKKIK